MLTPTQRDEAVQRYVAGEDGPTLGRVYGVSATAIIQLLRKRGVPRRSISQAKRRYLVDERAFRPPLNEEKLYWLGFLFADGCVKRDGYGQGPKVCLGISVRDLPHLEKFRTFLGSTHPIKYRWHYLKRTGKRYQTVNLEIRSQALARDLEAWGRGPKNRSYAHRALARSRHFWRGVVDGDGSLYQTRGRPLLALLGGYFLLGQYLVFLREHNVLTGATVRPAYNTVWQVSLCASPAVAAAKVLYNKSRHNLVRKMARAEEWSWR